MIWTLYIPTFLLSFIGFFEITIADVKYLPASIGHVFIAGKLVNEYSSGLKTISWQGAFLTNLGKILDNFNKENAESIFSFKELFSLSTKEIKFSDFYGVDTPTKKELLAANNSIEEMCKFINAKSLKFLSLEGLYKAMGFDKRNNLYPQLTDHYFTGDYPIKPTDNLGDSKITQLSLLSSGQKN